MNKVRNLVIYIVTISLLINCITANSMRKPGLGPLEENDENDISVNQYENDNVMNNMKNEDKYRSRNKFNVLNQDATQLVIKEEEHIENFKKKSPKMEDFYIDEIPNKFKTNYWKHSLGKSWSGRIQLEPLVESEHNIKLDENINKDKEDNAKYFFWLFESHPNAISDAKDKIIIWLNGGPGCSSMIGGLQEIGPMMMGNDSFLHPNEWGWHLQGNLIFVDQPGGVGMSTTNNYVKTHNEMAFSFVKFLQNFYHIFEDFVEGKDLYITGESYAGIYIPYISAAIMQSKQFNGKPFPLKSLAIGNAYINLHHNYYRQSLIADSLESMKFFGNDTNSLEEFRTFTKETDKIVKELELKQDYKKRRHLLDKERNWEDWVQAYLNNTREETFLFNVYNAFIDKRNDELSTKWIEKFFARKDVRKALHIDDTNHEWKQCNDKAGDVLRKSQVSPGFDKGSSPILESLLNAGLSVTLYSGNWDLACSSETVEKGIEDMSFNGGKGLGESLQHRSNRTPLYDAFGRLAGEFATRGALQWIRVNSSGHFVPFDYPQAAIQVIGRAIYADNGWYKPTDNFTLNLPF